MKKIVCTAALMLIVGPALAEDAFAPKVNKFASPALTTSKHSKHTNWTGFYAGGHTGLSAGNGDTRWSNSGSGPPSSFKSTSPTFGAHAGYNYQFGQGVLLGGESDVSNK
jgi:outer membrane immunogenic protein